MSTDAFVRWSFGHYLNIAPPEFAGPPRRVEHVEAGAARR